MNKRYIIGIDPSPKTLACTILVQEDLAFGVEKTQNFFEEFNSWPSFHKKLKDLIYFINKYDEGIIPVALEGIVFRGKFPNEASIKFGCMLRYALLEHGNKFIEVHPTTLKKFITGDGKAKKEAILKSVKDIYGLDFGSNDHLADAASLGIMVALSNSVQTSKEDIEEYYDLSYYQIKTLEELWRKRQCRM